MFAKFEVMKQTAHLVDVRIELIVYGELSAHLTEVRSEFAVSLTMYVSRKVRGGGVAYRCIYLYISIYIYLHSADYGRYENKNGRLYI